MFRFDALPNEIQAQLKTICELAIKEDEQALWYMNNEVSINANYHGMTALYLLARDGNVDAVNFLIDTFDACVEDAYIGYILGGYIQECKKLMAENPAKTSNTLANAMLGEDRLVADAIAAAVDPYTISNLKEALTCGYVIVENMDMFKKAGMNDLLHIDIAAAFAYYGDAERARLHLPADTDEEELVSCYAKGNNQRAEFLINQGANKNNAAYGYALGGHHIQANELMKRGAKEKYIYAGYCSVLDFKSINHMVAKSTSKAKAASYIAHYHYCYHGYLTLRTLSSIDHPKIRALLAKPPEVADLLETAGVLNAIMRNHQLSFNQASKFLILTTAENIWLLQGIQLVKQDKMHATVFMCITSELLGLTPKSVEKVSLAVRWQLCGDAAEFIRGKYKQGFFSKAVMRAKQDVVNTNFVLRKLN